VDMVASEGEYKTSPIFPSGSVINVLKMLTFYRKGPFDLKAEYSSDAPLLPGTPQELGLFKIDLPPQSESKKIKVKAKLSIHGTFALEGAQMIEEEEYEETVKEKRELPPDEPKAEDGAKAEGEPADAGAPSPPPAEPSPAGTVDGDAPMPDQKEAWQEDGTTKPAGENGTADAKKEPEKPKAPEKKYEWVEVKKMKRRTKRTDLNIVEEGRPGLSLDVLQKRMDEETAMQVEMREIIDTDAKRNDLEGYIFDMRDKCASSGQYGAFIADADRDQFMTALTGAEDWLYEADDYKKVQYVEKLDELKATGDPFVWRFREDGMRDEWIAALKGTIANYEVAAAEPGEKYGHIAAEKLAKITTACVELQAWLEDGQAKQAALAKSEKPVLLCAEMEKKNKELATISDDVLKEPKPAPPKEEKKPEDEKKEETKEGEAAAPADGAAAEAPKAEPEAPQNMDVD